MVELPTGTVTFLFTDIEGSTRLWEQYPDVMPGLLEQHDGVLREAVESNCGLVVKSTGDGTIAVFSSAPDACAAATAAQVSLAGWTSAPSLRVRMGLHTGAATERDGDYFGSTLNRAARLMAIGHGGQILVSHATEQLVRDLLRDGVELADLGEHRLRDLSSPERVFQLCVPGLGVEFPPVRSLDVLRTNLPVQLTSFVGRDDDVKTVGELLHEHRVVTLTGVGGVGKTRLALQVAADLLDGYPDGVWLVELAPLGEEGRVVEAIAAAFGVDPSPGKTVEQSLLGAIRSSSVLVVLDNCEHLLDEVSRVAGVLAGTAPELVVLATSREPLGVRGEHVVALRSLDPATSVQLFTERAEAVDASFAVSDEDVEVVEHLCRRLDGIPLAIELAAARVRMFSAAELAERLDQRFRLLTGGRGAVERHQTLRAAIDWSYDLLFPRDRAVFDRLSMFAGGSTLDAAQALCSGDDVDDIEVVDALASLIDKSLVVAERSEIGTRYRQLETIRQYAEEQLMASGSADGARERHARYFGDFARDAGRKLWSDTEVEWARRVEADLDNVRAAVSWAVAAGETDLAMRIAGALVTQAVERPIWTTASIAEEALRASDADQHPWRAIVMGEASWAAQRRGDSAAARELVDGALDAQRAGARFTAPVWSYAAMHRAEDDSGQDALALAAEGLERAEAAGDATGAIALRTMYVGQLVQHERGAEARAEAEQALASARALGQPALIAMGLFALGLALASSGEPDRGITIVRESIEVSDQIGSTWQAVGGLSALAALEALYGDAAQAASSMRTVLESARDTSEIHQGLGVINAGLPVFNRYDRADLVARADGQLGSLRAPVYGNYIIWYRRAVADARAALGDQRYDALAAEGATIPWESYVAETLEHLDTFIQQGQASPHPPAD
jgi:predicted ATPase/class 3 adenylate cyclase